MADTGLTGHGAAAQANFSMRFIDFTFLNFDNPGSRRARAPLDNRTTIPAAEIGVGPLLADEPTGLNRRPPRCRGYREV